MMPYGRKLTRTILARRFLLSTVVLAAPLALAAVPTASAAVVSESASGNWAGYVAASSSSSGFSKVSGSWVQPTASCTSGDGYAAFWVGLGGSGQSQSLEQTGTQADCSGGSATYYSWYELVPSAPVKIPMTVRPGDHISGSVSVSGTSVNVYIADQTTGSSFTKTLQMSSPDTSSAEWIAEAPSTEDGFGNYSPLPLSDFGRVTFTNASATSAGHTGSISDPAWSATAIQLQGSTAGAQPGNVSSDGSSFSVSWDNTGAYTSYGYGGPGSYGYGYGYPGYSYGYGGYSYGGYGPGGYAYYGPSGYAHGPYAY